mmetsp:Transcript_105890/g.228217  ORF Transcript_105890/g.228217 Transcript_105890/m.228217 type:complete len:103 (+) Transcript_105890:279-587(+)
MNNLNKQLTELHENFLASSDSLQDQLEAELNNELQLKNEIASLQQQQAQFEEQAAHWEAQAENLVQQVNGKLKFRAQLTEKTHAEHQDRSGHIQGLNEQIAN